MTTYLEILAEIKRKTETIRGACATAIVDLPSGAPRLRRIVDIIEAIDDARQGKSVASDPYVESVSDMQSESQRIWEISDLLRNVCDIMDERRRQELRESG